MKDVEKAQKHCQNPHCRTAFLPRLFRTAVLSPAASSTVRPRVPKDEATPRLQINNESDVPRLAVHHRHFLVSL